MSKYSEVIVKGVWTENPVFMMMLGMCPLLAVTTSAYNGLGMGVAASFVLICSNIVISLIRNFIPPKVRIPCFIVIIATFVTITDLVLAAFLPDLHAALGLFIPLIVVNCIILGRAEAFASKNSLLISIVDGVAMGIGFTLALFMLAAVREILGSGTLTLFQLGETIVQFDLLKGAGFAPIIVMILPPGAFLGLGFILAALKKIELAKAK